MDGESKKEQIGTLVVRVGALEGGGSGGSRPKSTRAFLEKKFPPSCLPPRILLRPPLRPEVLQASKICLLASQQFYFLT
eukprot:446835-Pelagomonas_calceolata.AAC.1